MLVKCFLKLLILWRTEPLQSLFLFETLNFIFMKTMIYMILICFLFIKIHIMSSNYVLKTLQNFLNALFHFFSNMVRGQSYNCLHFNCEEVEAWRD